MKISIFGLGYVGAVSAGCFSKIGHEVIGVDPNEDKVRLINNGCTPIIEEEIGEIIHQSVKEKRLSATQDVSKAVQQSDISIICVGTPSAPNGSQNLQFIRKVYEEIGLEIKKKKTYHIVVNRSTLIPGTMLNVVKPILEKASGKKAGVDFGLCINPEFLREGTAVYDFFNPPKTVIGESDTKSGDILTELYKDLKAPLVRTDLATAEMVKFTDNVWHALKITFANEIGNICEAVGIQGQKVMEIFCKDLKLNISTKYLMPGFAYGGSCLPKDCRALSYLAKMIDVDTPVIRNINISNQSHIERCLNKVIQQNNKNIGILGISFKEGTDDLRESPMVEIVERLIGKGYSLRIYDRNVNIASISGANRDYILNKIPHISKLMMSTVDGVLEHADTILVGNRSNEFVDIAKKLKSHQSLIDYVNITEGNKKILHVATTNSAEDNQFIMGNQLQTALAS